MPCIHPCAQALSGFAALSLLVGAARGEFDSRELAPGTVQWHYSQDNRVMEEGHRRIREWRAEVEAERLLLIESMQRRGLFKAAAGALDVLPPPVPLGTEHTFAKGMIKAKWTLNKVTNNTSGGTGYGAGVRLDRTVYDPDKNMLYALTTDKNLVQAPLTQLGSWAQRNHVTFIEKKGFTGVKTPEGKFRLIGSIKGEFRYSDDEGMSWTLSTGGAHDPGAVYFTEALGTGHILSHVRKRIGSVSSDVLIRSTDHGKTFLDLQSWPAAESNGIAATWLYNTDDHVLMVRNRSGEGTWDVHQYKGGAFSLLGSASVSGTPSSMTGTFHEGIKAYVGASSGGGFYSENGTSWTQRTTLKSRLMTVHPSRPGYLFSNSPQHDFSLDGGLTWQTYPSNDNTIGWDPKHLTYYKVNGTWTFVAANDMGLCFSTDPQVRTNWRYVNDNHTYAILHGGTAVDHTGLTVTVNQDPGTFELVRTGLNAYAARNKNSADGLRAAASNGGKAYWYRHYWETFMHSHAAFTNDTRKASLDMPGDWFTPPFKGTTAPGEDALYVTGQNQLVKLTYNAASNSISRSNLTKDFTAEGGVTWGVGVAKSDPKRLYVATKDGTFFRSADAGQTWTKSEYAGPKPQAQSSAFNQNAGYYIEVADANPDLVYFGGGGGNVACLLSKDGGKTFTAAQTGLPASARIGSLSLSPDGKLAFSSNYFVYVAADNAWYDLMAESMPTGALPSSTGLNYLPLQRKVRYFTWGAGVVDLDITFLNTPDHPAVALEPAKCYKLTAASGGQTLTAGSGDALKLGATSSAASQNWQFANVDGVYRIANVSTGKILQVASASYTEGAAIQLGDWGPPENQTWNVVRDGEAYAIVTRHSVKALEAGSGFKQTTYLGSVAQQWKIAETPGCVASEIRAARQAPRPIAVVRHGRSGSYRVVHGELEAFQILVYDAYGKLIHGADGTDAFSLSGQPGGLYYVKIKADHISLTEKIVHVKP